MSETQSTISMANEPAEAFVSAKKRKRSDSEDIATESDSDEEESEEEVPTEEDLKFIDTRSTKQIELEAKSQCYDDGDVNPANIIHGKRKRTATAYFKSDIPLDEATNIIVEQMEREIDPDWNSDCESLPYVSSSENDYLGEGDSETEEGDSETEEGDSETEEGDSEEEGDACEGDACEENTAKVKDEVVDTGEVGE